MLEVRMERVSYSINEKKTINPTMKMPPLTAFPDPATLKARFDAI